VRLVVIEYCELRVEITSKVNANNFINTQIEFAIFLFLLRKCNLWSNSFSWHFFFEKKETKKLFSIA